MKKFCLFFFFIFTAACVDLPKEQTSPAKITRLTGIELDPGYQTKYSLHFTLQTYSTADADKYGAKSEEYYSIIMKTAGLYSFVPKEPYQIIVLRNAEEYREKSGQPDWSAGVSIGNAILLYDGSYSLQTLAHELTHLIFFEYMGGAFAHELWINEGLAVYFEHYVNGQSALNDYANYASAKLSAKNFTFSDLRAAKLNALATEDVSLWYMQASSMVNYLIKNGGPLGFSAFLNALKNGASLDGAFAVAYPGKWRSVQAFDAAWRAEEAIK